MNPPLSEPFRIADVEIANRVLLAPLAGIGNWLVRLQARRHGAGMAFSEMVSSLALHHRNRRTMEEMLRIHPDEHPVGIQLFGPDPEVIRSASAVVAAAGADLVDLNMGCPVPKVWKTGAGAALLDDPDRAVEIARAAAEGSRRPVTVKLRSGLRPGDRSGLELAVRIANEAGVAAIAFHPRPASAHHQGAPDYAVARELVNRVQVPVIISGGLRSADLARRAFERSGAAALMVARGSLGNPWIFEELTGRHSRGPDADAIVAELLWLIDCARGHFGEARANRWLRKLYPHYLERLGIRGANADRYQRADSLAEVRLMIGDLAPAALAA